MSQFANVWIIFYCLIASVIGGDGSSEICPTDSILNIYSADSLSNGTIRLFSGDYYYELELYELAVPNVTEPNPSVIFNISGFSNRSVIGRIDLTTKRPISSTFHNLNFSMVDTAQSQFALVSLTDLDDLEYSLLFRSVLTGQNVSGFAHLNAEVLLYNRETGDYLSVFPIGENSNHTHNVTSGYLMSITTSFRAYINHTQYLFVTINQQLFFTRVTIESNVNVVDSMELNSADSMARGIVPSGITASFVAQLNEDQLWLVLIRCGDYCAVPWILRDSGFFNFTECNESDKWKSLSQLIISSNDRIPMNDTTPLLHYVPSNKVRKPHLDNSSTVFSISFIRERVVTFFVDYNEHDSTIRPKVGVFLVIGLFVSICLLVCSFAYYHHRFGVSYNMSAVEARELKRQKDLAIAAAEEGTTTGNDDVDGLNLVAAENVVVYPVLIATLDNKVDSDQQGESLSGPQGDETEMQDKDHHDDPQAGESLLFKV